MLQIVTHRYVAVGRDRMLQVAGGTVVYLYARKFLRTIYTL